MLQLAIRSAAILIVAWVAARLLTQASAATRHLVWHAAIVAVLLAPIALPLVPSVHVAVPLGLQRASSALAAQWDAAAAPDPHDTSPAAAGVQPPITVRQPGAPQNTENFAPTSTALVPAVWIVGSASVALWFVAGWLLALRLVRRGAEAPASWVAELDELRRKLRIDAAVGLRTLSFHGSPIVVGFFRSTILLPSLATRWSDDRRRAVLLHELAHIKRADCRVQALAQAACALYWFNPLAWHAYGALRMERERACDDEVLRTGALASSYAAHLLEIARDLRPAFGPRPALAMARPSELEGRVLAVLATERARVPVATSRWLVTAALVATTAVALSVTPLANADQPAPSSRTRMAARYLSSTEPTISERLEANRAETAATATIAQSTDPDAREHAVLSLAATASDTAIPALTRALADDSSQVREKAAFALGLLSSTDVIDPLLKALRDPDAQVREKAAMGLTLRRDARSVEALIQAAEDADAQVREKVAMALGTSGDPRAVAVLTRALSDPDSQVREKAALGLGLLGDQQPDAATAESVRGGFRAIVSGLLRLAK